MTWNRKIVLVLLIIVVLIIIIAYIISNRVVVDDDISTSNLEIYNWLVNMDAAERASMVTEGGIACPDAPFILPSEGFIGLLWRDPARPYDANNRHTGVDIFGLGPSGTIPIYAAYDGYLTRNPDWKATVTIQHDDPLQPGRKIWTYYTHMADVTGQRDFISEEFPQGTVGKWVEQGTLLGYQGEYAGAGSPIAMHLHFSMVTSNPDGTFRNEAVLGNTIDPSPYFGLDVNFQNHPSFPIRCAGS